MKVKRDLKSGDTIPSNIESLVTILNNFGNLKYYKLSTINNFGFKSDLFETFLKNYWNLRLRFKTKGIYDLIYREYDLMLNSIFNERYDKIGRIYHMKILTFEEPSKCFYTYKVKLFKNDVTSKLLTNKDLSSKIIYEKNCEGTEHLSDDWKYFFQ